MTSQIINTMHHTHLISTGMMSMNTMNTSTMHHTCLIISRMTSMNIMKAYENINACDDWWRVSWIFNKGGLDHLLPKFEHIFVAAITFSPFLLCRYFYYQHVAYCVCFKMTCGMSL